MDVGGYPVWHEVGPNDARTQSRTRQGATAQWNQRANSAKSRGVLTKEILGFWSATVKRAVGERRVGVPSMRLLRSSAVEW